MNRDSVTAAIAVINTARSMHIVVWTELGCRYNAVMNAIYFRPTGVNGVQFQLSIAGNTQRE